MMKYPSVDEIRKNNESRYELVILVAKRARDIVDGAPVLVDGMDPEKAVTVAISEIAEGYIKCGKDELEETKEELLDEILEEVKSYMDMEDLEGDILPLNKEE